METIDKPVPVCDGEAMGYEPPERAPARKLAELRRFLEGLPDVEAAFLVHPFSSDRSAGGALQVAIGVAAEHADRVRRAISAWKGPGPSVEVVTYEPGGGLPDRLAAGNTERIYLQRED